MPTLLEKNRSFYESLWAKAKLVPPNRFNTWPLISELVQQKEKRLEIGPGMRPRLPIADTSFVDISEQALACLKEAGGHTHQAEIHSLPFEDDQFDLIAVLDIIEHVEDDKGALAEICRVARPGATILLAVPLFGSCWTPFDDIVGHHRRYELEELQSLFETYGLSLRQSCVYGMAPKSNWLVDWGMRYLEKNPERAMWYYNQIFMPIGLRLQKPLQFEDGWCDLSGGADEIFLVCELKESSE